MTNKTPNQTNNEANNQTNNEALKPLIIHGKSCSNNIEDIYFAKVKPEAIIPSKEDYNAGYDIYACFEQDSIIIHTHETKAIPTGIASMCSSDYCFILKERGSTGTIGIGQRCGVIDSSYQGEWFVPITNHNTQTLIISKKHNKVEKFVNSIYYPYSKAICQALLIPVPKAKVNEITYEDLLSFESERGLGCLGSSGK